MEAIKSKLYLAEDVPPFVKVYGYVDRLQGTDTVPAAYDPETGVTSKDVVIQPETGLSVRIYRPTAACHQKKLPLVIYFHGGAFLINSTAEPTYQKMLNIQVQDAKVLLVSVDYRLAPESPIPTLYNDSWAAIKWVASHISGEKNGPDEIWLREFVNFNKVFLAGDSAGANIAHHMTIRAGLINNSLGNFKISGTLLVHPYFLGKYPIGSEADDPATKAMIDKWWLFICPSDRGCDDPYINPFAIGAPNIARLACDKILVCIAGLDFLRERGKLYYKNLGKSEWKGKAEFYESQGENHVFHILDPTTEDAKKLFSRIAKFFNDE